MKLPPDPPWPDPEWMAVNHRLTPLERLKIADCIWLMTRMLLRGVIVHKHPDWSDARVDHEIALRMLASSDDLDPKVFAEVKAHLEARLRRVEASAG